MTPEIRDTNSTAEFILWLPSHTSTLSWQGMPLQGLRALIFLLSYGLHFPVHDTQHGETPLDGICQKVEQWNPHFNRAPPSTAAKNNRDNRWRESWDVEPSAPQAPFVFSVRGIFFHAIPALEHSRFWEWHVQSFSSPEFSWLCKPWLTLGMLEFTPFGIESKGWGTAQAELLLP